MTTSEETVFDRTIVMNSEAVADAIHQIATEIIVNAEDIHSIVFLGILRRGKPLAERLADEIESITGVRPAVGSLATTLYRDDLRAGIGRVKYGGGETHFDFSIDGVTVILVDDVVAAGRTTRAALDEVMDYGRPERIQLAALVDRGGRELPIQPDYLGRPISARSEDHVSVRFTETDGEDIVLLERGPVPTGQPEEAQ